VPLKPYKYMPGHLGYRLLHLNKDKDNTIINNSQANTSGVKESISTPQKGELVV
jgi:hypothetical protein